MEKSIKLFSMGDTEPIHRKSASVDTLDTNFGILETLNEYLEDTDHAMENLAYSQYASIMYVTEHMDPSPTIVTEGANDFFKSITNIIKRLISKIKEIYQKIIRWIQSRTMSMEKFIKKHKKHIVALGESFDMDGYHYNIERDVPNVSFVDSLVNEYNDDIQQINKLTFEEIVNKVESHDSEAFTEEICGKLINSPPTPQDDYNETLFAYFRSGTDMVSTITVDKSTVIDIVTNYNALQKEISEFKKERNRTISFLNDLEKFFERGAKLVKSDNKVRADLYKLDTEAPDLIERGDVQSSTHASIHNVRKITTYFSMRHDEARIISSNTLLVLNAKMEALREKSKWQENVIRKSLSYKREEI